MNIELNETDVLQGFKVIEADKRDGTKTKVRCNALNWAASCRLLAGGEPSETLLFTVLSGVEKPLANDEFLNQLTPEALSEISSVVFQLTNGLPGLKKAQAARSQNAPQAIPTSTLPPANCADTDSAVASALDSAPRS
jgi:hypothetical protein